ncbi:copper amine oxidase [Parapedobacter deserti]|uniref:Copper amine oxidase n=1 Tax=Parapedobacter deserti TaxID=1912957 RepID=A0ABV7JDA7_9SPHI
MNLVNKGCLIAVIVGMWGCSTVAQVAQLPDASQQAQLLQAKQGAVVTLENLLSTDISKIDYNKTILPGPQFIISDDPEYIRLPEAMVLREQVQPGAVRLYVYNVNGVKEPHQMERKITALIRNTGNYEMSIRMLRYSSQPASKNYFQVGKQGLADFFASQPSETVRKVAPGGLLAIDEELETQAVKYDELVHGFYEFVIDQPAEISVLQTAVDTPSEVAYARIDSVVPNSHVNAGRGLFGVSNYRISNTEPLDTKDGIAQLIVADGSDDPWITGTVGEAQEPARNAGNYGVLYDVKLKWKSSDGKGLALVTWNSRSADNQWCGGMGLTMVMDNGVHPAGIVQLPSDRLITKAAPEAIVVQVYKPAPEGEEQEIRFTYSPPGASCLPTPLVLIPIDVD